MSEFVPITEVANEPPRTSRMAVASLVLGIASFLLWLLTGLPAVILGTIALVQIRNSRGQLKGEGMAIAGIVTAGISAFLIIPLMLAAMLLPAVHAAREAAQRNMSMNNMKQIVIGLNNYMTSMREYPAPGGGTGSQLSWRVHILPYMDHPEATALYKEFHLDEPWDSPHNKSLIARMPEMYADPSVDVPPGHTVYLAVTGPGTAFSDADDSPTPRDFADGASQTILFVEADPEQAVEWTRPADWPFDPNNPRRGLGNVRSRPEFVAAFADGGIRPVTDDTPPDVVRAFMTRSGHEQIEGN